MVEGKHFDVPVDHLPLPDRLEAAMWCIEKFGYDNVNMWVTSEKAFQFAKEKDANWFALRWG